MAQQKSVRIRAVWLENSLVSILAVVDPQFLENTAARAVEPETVEVYSPYKGIITRRKDVAIIKPNNGQEPRYNLSCAYYV